ncbi:nucleoside-diphosphate kinase [Clonorchis sinensis]|uniref:Nucleoside-diphosphate kinase n=1 Tax=Clonorchis sinensis TaxID=79923 RepID=G7YTD2_CLOSI|nr:nucleoside-diphosphate kinase [Clonorchis sinensis]
MHGEKGSEDITKIDAKKDLGIWLSPNLSFSLHLEKSAQKAFAVLRMIRRTFSRITRTDFQIFYEAHVRPLLEYANPVVYSGRTEDVILIGRVQRAATKMVAGLKSMDYEARLAAPVLSPLECRRLRGDLFLTYALFEQGLVNSIFTVDPANTRRGHGLIIITCKNRAFVVQWLYLPKVRGFHPRCVRPVLFFSASSAVASQVHRKETISSHKPLNNSPSANTLQIFYWMMSMTILVNPKRSTPDEIRMKTMKTNDNGEYSLDWRSIASPLSAFCGKIILRVMLAGVWFRKFYICQKLDWEQSDEAKRVPKLREAVLRGDLEVKSWYTTYINTKNQVKELVQLVVYKVYATITSRNFPLFLDAPLANGIWQILGYDWLFGPEFDQAELALLPDWQAVQKLLAILVQDRLLGHSNSLLRERAFGPKWSRMYATELKRAENSMDVDALPLSAKIKFGSRDPKRLNRFDMALYANSRDRVKVYWKLSPEFTTPSYIMQGCPLSPLLSNLLRFRKSHHQPLMCMRSKCFHSIRSQTSSTQTTLCNDELPQTNRCCYRGTCGSHSVLDFKFNPHLDALRSEPLFHVIHGVKAGFKSDTVSRSFFFRELVAHIKPSGLWPRRKTISCTELTNYRLITLRLIIMRDTSYNELKLFVMPTLCTDVLLEHDFLGPHVRRYCGQEAHSARDWPEERAACQSIIKASSDWSEVWTQHPIAIHPLATLDNGYVFYAPRVGDLVGVFKMPFDVGLMSIRKSMRVIRRKMHRSYLFEEWLRSGFEKTSNPFWQISVLLVFLGRTPRQHNITIYRSSDFHESVCRTGEIISNLEGKGFRLVNLKIFCPTSEEITTLIGNLVDYTKLPHLLTELSETNIVAVEVMGNNACAAMRELVGGPSGPEKGTIFVSSKDMLVFATDPESSAAQAEMIFGHPGGPRFRGSPRLKGTTLAIIKPHAVSDGLTGSIWTAIREHGFCISAARLYRLSKADAAEFLEVYKGVAHEYPEMLDQLACGPCVALEIASTEEGVDVQKTFREFVGPLDPEIAKFLRPQTLRAKFGVDKIHNAVHCTDLPEDTELEHSSPKKDIPVRRNQSASLTENMFVVIAQLAMGYKVSFSFVFTVCSLELVGQNRYIFVITSDQKLEQSIRNKANLECKCLRPCTLKDSRTDSTQTFRNVLQSPCQHHSEIHTKNNTVFDKRKFEGKESDKHFKCTDNYGTLVAAILRRKRISAVRTFTQEIPRVFHKR